MAKMTMVQALNLALHQEMAKDDRVIVLGEDVGLDGGVFRVTDGLIHTFGSGARPRYPTGRIRHCRLFHRDGRVWTQTGLRNAVFGIQLFCHAPDGSSCGSPEVALPGALFGTDGAAGAIRRWGSSPRTPLGEP